MAGFLKKALGGKADTYIDQAVDQAAVLAKDKARTFMGGDVKGQKGAGASGTSGTSGGVTPSPKEQPKPTPVNVPQNINLPQGDGGAQVAVGGGDRGTGDLTDDLMGLVNEGES